MFYRLGTYLLAPLLVFGLYHLLTWFNLFRINGRATWVRVAIASAISHVLLVSGFIGFSYFQFKASTGVSFGAFVFRESEFWRLMTVFDTGSMFAVLGLFSILDRMGINPPGLLVLTFVIVYAVGTLQWVLLGAGIGALLEKFWAGLKTGDEEDEQWL